MNRLKVLHLDCSLQERSSRRLSPPAIRTTAVLPCPRDFARWWPWMAWVPRGIWWWPPTATFTSRCRVEGTGRRRCRAARHQGRRPLRHEGNIWRWQQHRHRAAERLSVHRQGEFGGTVQDDSWRIEAAGERRDGGQRFAGRAPAWRQGDCVRRKRLALRQCGRALQRLSVQGPESQVARPGSLPDPREARRHLEVRREQTGTDAGRRRALRDRPAPDAGYRLARRRAVHRDEQSRSARHMWPGKFTAQENAERPRSLVSCGARLQLRLAILLL